MLSLDFEVCGVDIRHGAAPFFLSSCNEKGIQQYWKWHVEPTTRQTVIPQSDLEEIAALIGSHDELVFQNAPFDMIAFQAIGLFNLISSQKMWAKIRDTLISGHLLASNQKHDLTTMTLVYLDDNIEGYELRLRNACLKSRALAKKQFPEWRLAHHGDPMMPSIKASNSRDEDKPWKNDCWLPEALAEALEYPKPKANCKHQWIDNLCSSCKGHFWYEACSEYANKDSYSTLRLWRMHRKLLLSRSLWDIYLESQKASRVFWEMGCGGMTVIKKTRTELSRIYGERVEELSTKIVGLAASYDFDLKMTKSINNSTKEFIIDVLKLEKLYDPKAKSDAPCFNSKIAIPHYLDTLAPRSSELWFVKSWAERSALSKSREALESYASFAVENLGEWFKIHPSVNQTGTDTLRGSSYNPNGQNISKKKINKNPLYNARRCFGPAEGREYWSLDAKNLELRIPAYESGEEEFIALFERPDEPPYFGSNHLLIAHLLHKKAFEACRGVGGIVDGRIFKELYDDTLYGRTKNGNFAVQYGAVDTYDGKSTADRTYGIPGAQRTIASRFARMEWLNQREIAFANEHGYVCTIPDKTVDPLRGYPILCTRTKNGRVKQTVPLNYHVQSSAMWWMRCSMVRCQTLLDQWRNKTGFDGFIAMQIHDELLFDFPKAAHPLKDAKNSNLGRIIKIKWAMEQGGENFVIHIPTPVSVKYHSENWANGVQVA